MPDINQMPPPGQPAPQGQQNPITSFFSDPKNLATGLVFLAALAQGRRPGQNAAGQVGQAALATGAFRGGMESGLRRERQQDEAITNQRTQQSKENEFRGRQVSIQEQGLDLQRSGQSQAARLASEENASRERAAVAEGSSEARLRNAQARLADRTDPNLRSGSGSNPAAEMMEKSFLEAQKQIYANEIATAQMEGRAPNLEALTPQLSRLNLQYRMMATEGIQFTRRPDGSVGISFSAPGGATEPGSGGPQSSVASPVAGQGPTPAAGQGVDFNTDVPITPVERAPARPPTGRRGGGTSELDAEAGELEKLPKEKLLAWLRDPRLTPDQRLKVSDAFNGRGPAARARAKLATDALGSTTKKAPRDPNRPY